MQVVMANMWLFVNKQVGTLLLQRIFLKVGLFFWTSISLVTQTFKSWLQTKAIFYHYCPGTEAVQNSPSKTWRDFTRRCHLLRVHTYPALISGLLKFQSKSLDKRVYSPLRSGLGYFTFLFGDLDDSLSCAWFTLRLNWNLVQLKN